MQALLFAVAAAARTDFCQFTYCYNLWECDRLLARLDQSLPLLVTYTNAHAVPLGSARIEYEQCVESVGGDRFTRAASCMFPAFSRLYERCAYVLLIEYDVFWQRPLTRDALQRIVSRFSDKILVAFIDRHPQTGESFGDNNAVGVYNMSERFLLTQYDYLTWLNRIGHGLSIDYEFAIYLRAVGREHLVVSTSSMLVCLAACGSICRIAASYEMLHLAKSTRAHVLALPCSVGLTATFGIAF